MGERGIQERNDFNNKKKCNEKRGIIWSDFHPLIGCLVGLLRRGREKKINYVIYICTVKFVLRLKSNLGVYSAIAWNHTTSPTDDSQETLDDFQIKISIMLLFRAFWKIEEWEKDGKCLLRVTIQKFSSSSEESRNADVFLWSHNGKYEKLLLHCKWIYWEVFFPAKVQGVYAPVNLCVCMCVFAYKTERHWHRTRNTKLICIYPKACYAFLSYIFGKKHHKVLKYISI